MPEAILLKDVENVGRRGDVVDVSKGYLRNYLQPRGLAFAATDRRAEAQAAHKEMGALLPRLDASRRPLAIAHMDLEATIAAVDCDVVAIGT
ncbi:MAG TPA: 50S ribosomal protein L9, partial [Baekduia sp.]|nr:50S ribosomal protein L9 [Baekduia sp.]